MRRTLALASGASFLVYLTPLVGPHMITLLGAAVLHEVMASGSRGAAWVATDVAVLVAAQTLMGLAAAWTLVRPRRRWAMVPVAWLSLVFTLPSIYLVIIPSRFLIEPDVAVERHDWVERCVIPDTAMIAIRAPVSVAASRSWPAYRSTGRYAIVRPATCEAIDARVPQPSQDRSGRVNFMVSAAFASPRGGTMFDRTETSTGARSWWRLAADGQRFDPLPIEAPAVLTVLSNDGDAVGWLEQIREADAPAYRLHVRSMDPVYERIVRVPFAAIECVPVELDTAARRVMLWADDRLVTLDFDGAIVGQSPSTRSVVRAQAQTYVRSADGWLAWDAYRDEGRYALAWSFPSGTGRHEERKGRAITSAALDPSRRYVAVSATTTLSIGHVRDTIYVLRADTGAEVYRRYLPTYTRATVAFFDGGLFAYSDAAGTHVIVLP